MPKKILISFILLAIMLLSGCAGKSETLLYFEVYNQLENPPGESWGGDFTFEVNEKRYEVMDGYTAEHLKIAKEDKNNRYKVIMVDADRKEILSIMTEKEYDVEAVRVCIDTDGTVYILYSIWETMIGNLFLDDLKSTYILKIDMKTMEVKKQYDFGVKVIVLTVHDGYVYTMEDGRVYRKLLNETGNKACMADLEFRGKPNRIEMDSMGFFIEKNGIRIIVHSRKEDSKYYLKDGVIADIKYTDQPIDKN